MVRPWRNRPFCRETLGLLGDHTPRIGEMKPGDSPQDKAVPGDAEIPGAGVVVGFGAQVEATLVDGREPSRGPESQLGN